jgi:hypothetical protein
MPASPAVLEFDPSPQASVEKSSEAMGTSLNLIPHPAEGGLIESTPQPKMRSVDPIRLSSILTAKEAVPDSPVEDPLTVEQLRASVDALCPPYLEWDVEVGGKRRHIKLEKNVICLHLVGGEGVRLVYVHPDMGSEMEASEVIFCSKTNAENVQENVRTALNKAAGMAAQLYRPRAAEIPSSTTIRHGNMSFDQSGWTGEQA